MPNLRRGAATAAAVLAVAVGGTGCAGGEESSSARRSADRWATAVCSDLGRWIDAAAPGSPAAASEAALQLRARVAGTRPPHTDDGLAAQGEMEKLTTGIEREVRTADQVAVAKVVADSRVAVDGIRGLTPGGAVEAALDHVATCRALRG
jgi:LPS sulfotransferase NodH